MQQGARYLAVQEQKLVGMGLFSLVGGFYVFYNH